MYIYTHICIRFSCMCEPWYNCRNTCMPSCLHLWHVCAYMYSVRTQESNSRGMDGCIVLFDVLSTSGRHQSLCYRRGSAQSPLTAPRVFIFWTFPTLLCCNGRWCQCCSGLVVIAEFGYCCGSVLCPLCARPVSTIASVMPSHMVRHVSVFHGVVTGVVTSVTFGLAWKSVMGVEVRINGNLCFLLLLRMLRDGIVGLCDYDSLVRLPIIVIII